MAENLAGLKRTHMCGEVTGSDVGHEVVVMGWVQKRRELGRLIFVDLRDRTGLLQIVFKSELDSELHNKALQLRNEYVIAVRGVLQVREDINPNMKTGEWEVIARELRILSRAETPPIHIEDIVDTSEATRLRYRFLDLRRPAMQKNLMLRHKVAKIARDYFDEQGFLEIETPVLIKSTPEGARDYLVPSRVFPGRFFALPQSPQLFKQILMVSGFDRYMQIAKCFRDEDLRADRQPEFTQIDLEMSFVDVPDVLTVCEGFIKRVFGEVLGVDVQIPFQRMTYAEAMERFGSDKPDTRFGFELTDVTEIVKNSGFKVFADAVERGGSVRAINAKGCGAKFSRKEIDALTEVTRTYGAKGMAWIAVEDGNLRSSFTKFLTEDEINRILDKVQAEPGDLVCFVADANEIVFEALGHLRLEIARKLDLLDENKYNFLWVTEFPLFEYDSEEERWVAIHHPFTSPMDEDIPLLETDPGKVRSKSYDIVLNGVELGGGSIRIHDQELQRKLFKLIGLSDQEAQERFGFLLEAFRYGTPPHGGLAFGLDRLVMLMVKCESLRDVIAFPKVQNSTCLMTGAPDFVDEKQLKELHIQTVDAENEK
ncbi:MAG: aspartate--tRNA ligase [Clostridiaceae bacterium]|nr:aspartate--tRNA ligase [Clostridiaceae bacterium]